MAEIQKLTELEFMTRQFLDANGRALTSEREVARLTEALAAAEQSRREHEQRWLQAEREGMAAERDRDVANALLRRAERYIPNGSLNDDLKAHLSSQPAAQQVSEALIVANAQLSRAAVRYQDERDAHMNEVERLRGELDRERLRRAEADRLTLGHVECSEFQRLQQVNRELLSTRHVAERDRDAANALLREAQESVHSVPGLRARINAHLSSQPAAPNSHTEA